MGVSTDGQISYGIIFEEEFEFPWDNEKYHEEIDDWWLYGVHGFKHSVEIYDETGGYLNGKEPDKETLNRYFTETREFLKAHPLPIAVLNYCSCDYPMYALVLPRTVMTAHRGSPECFNPETLRVTEEERNALIGFCSTYGIECGEPAWFLSSLWC